MKIKLNELYKESELLIEKISRKPAKEDIEKYIENQKMIFSIEEKAIITINGENNTRTDHTVREIRNYIQSINNILLAMEKAGDVSGDYISMVTSKIQFEYILQEFKVNYTVEIKENESANSLN